MSTLFFLPDGTVRGLYTEAIDLSALGPLNVQRATSLEFDNRLGAWRVFDLAGHCLYCSTVREFCLAWEQEYVNRVLENTPPG
jgi:hypothetical protein